MQSVRTFKQRFAERPTRALDELLPEGTLQKIVAEEVGEFRNRIYPPLTTLGLFIEQALSPDGACQDAVARHLSERTARGATPCTLNTGPYCNARKRLPLALITRLAETVGKRLQDFSRKTWQWRGRPVKLLDGTTVSMPDTPDNQAVYPQSGTQKTGLGFPVAMLVALISLSTGAVLRWASGPCRGKGTGEQALFRTLMPEVAAGDIILVDCYHCTYFTIAMLMAQGVDILTRQHQRRVTDFRKGLRLGRKDHLATWVRPQRPTWMDKETYEHMPEQITVRETRVAGRILVSTLVNAASVTPRDLDALYSQRWQVEVDLRSIKAVMGMDILRAKTAVMVDKEIAAHVLAYNLVRGLMARSASAIQVTVRALSFKGTLQLLLAFQQHVRWAGRKSLDIMIAHLLGAIAQMVLPVRPGRVEPRAIKRRPKPHKLLTVPRHIARANILRQRHARAAA